LGWPNSDILIQRIPIWIARSGFGYPKPDWDDQNKQLDYNSDRLGQPDLQMQGWYDRTKMMSSQQKWNPVWDNPNIDTGMHIHKKSKLGYD
jgi:hypothetical protein